MNFGTRPESAEQFQIAPMIDIVFVVLVFFIATYAVAQEEKRFEVRLPETTTGDAVHFSRQQIVVHLDADGRIFVEQRRFSPAYLERRLAQLVQFASDAEGRPSVIIRADSRCRHGDVMAVMDVCARAGITKIDFASVTPQKEPGH